MGTDKAVSDVLMNMFREICKLEEKNFITESFKDISSNDIHIINAIGLGVDSTMSKVAKKMGITAGSLTTSINNLVNKNYVSRVRGNADRRRVYISLTEEGKRAYRSYANFHRNLSATLLNSIKEEEVSVLMKALNNVRDFLGNYKT